MNDALKNFWVITPYFNSVQHKTRQVNYHRFMKICQAAGVNVLTVEVIFGDRPAEVTTKDDPFHLQLRCPGEEFWFKENMINRGIEYICARFPEMITEDGIIAWIDADCAPVCPPAEWFEMTKKSLDHYLIVQMFEWLVDLGPEYQVINGPNRGFMASYEHYGRRVPKIGDVVSKPSEAGYGRTSMGGPGLAWAARVSTLSALGMLIDITILGAGDWWMAHALLGLVTPDMNEVRRLPSYGQYILNWQKRALHYVKKDVGFVKVAMYHYFHGLKEETRFYGTRGQILIRHDFNWLEDLKRDSQGLWQLEVITDRQIAMRDDLRTYMHTRNEDSIPLRQLPNLPEYHKPKKSKEI